MSTTQADLELKFKRLAWYAKRSWPIFPCGGDKQPLTKHGFKDATLDVNQIRTWNKKYPDALWGMPTGPADQGGAGLVVIDIDALGGKHKLDGSATWEQLREEHSAPIETVTVKTGGGGRQLYFKYPAGHVVKTGQNVLGPGVDCKALGGYVIVPPSKTDAPYTFELSPKDCDVMDLPAWILARVNGRKEPAPAAQRDKKNLAAEYAKAMQALIALKPERADDYQEWLNVGMALSELGEPGLIAWDGWSKKSSKYKPGECAQKWMTFNKDETTQKITLGSLYHWAQEDGKLQMITPGHQGAKPSEYVRALLELGFNFTLNDMNDLIYVNGIPGSDILNAVITYQLREHDYKNTTDTTSAIYKTAYDNKFHPIKDYLNGLILDGSQDHIARLASFFEDKDKMFPALLRKWMIGAVGRVMGGRPGQQHPMLVLDGPQGIGKSRFVWWLGSPLPTFYIQSSINTDDKDFLINLCSKFVWEVEELGATLRKSDIESLKAFLSKEIVSVRKPYGHDAITKPATASFIGTINNSGGFLADPTGSRRFRVCTLSKIDWAYEAAIDVNQLWAQAREMYTAGEGWELDPKDEMKMREINERYDVDDPLHFDIVDTFNINPRELNQWTTTAQIIHRLRADGKTAGGNDNQLAQRIANILGKLGCERKTARINGQLVRGWVGVWLEKP